MVNVYQSAAQAEASSPYATNPQSSGQYQQQQQQQNQSQNQQQSGRRTAHWDQARQEWVAGEPTQESNYNNRPSGNNPSQAYGQQGQQLTYQQQALLNAQTRPGFTDPSTYGDTNTQAARNAVETANRAFGLMGMPLIGLEAATGGILETQRQNAYAKVGQEVPSDINASPGFTKEERFYTGELQKWGENKVEISSAYHDVGMQQDTNPIPANPFEYQGDLAVEFLKGSPQKSSEYFSPVSGEESRYLPGGKGLQEYAWEEALAVADRTRTRPENVSFMDAIGNLNAAEGKYGPYGALYGGDKWMQQNPKSPSETIRMNGIRLTEQQAMDIDWAAGAGKQQANALFGEQDRIAAAKTQSEKISFLGGAGLPAGVFATGQIGKVETGNAPFFAPQQFKLQSPVGGLIGLQLWGEKKDEVIKGLAGSSVDFVTGMVGWTPFADRMTETAPELSAFRVKKQTYETQLESLGKTGEERFGKDEQGRILIDQTNSESLAFQRDYSKVTGQYETFMQESKTKGLVIEEQGKMIENPYLVYEYGEFTKWGIGVGASTRNALGISKQSLDSYQSILEQKQGVANIPEKLAFGAVYTSLTHPEKAMSAAGGGALFVLGGEVIGGMYAGSGVATRAGAFALSHPTAAAIGTGAFRYGGAAVLGGLTYYGASEGLTASPERTTINFGKMIPEFGGMIAGGAAVYRGMGYQGIGFISKEVSSKRKEDLTYGTGYNKESNSYPDLEKIKGFEPIPLRTQEKMWFDQKLTELDNPISPADITGTPLNKMAKEMRELQYGQHREMEAFFSKEGVSNVVVYGTEYNIPSEANNPAIVATFEQMGLKDVTAIHTHPIGSSSLPSVGDIKHATLGGAGTHGVASDMGMTLYNFKKAWNRYKYDETGSISSPSFIGDLYEEMVSISGRRTREQRYSDAWKTVKSNKGVEIIQTRYPNRLVNYAGLDFRKNKDFGQELKPAPTIVDLRDLVDLTLAPERPANVATRAEQAKLGVIDVKPGYAKWDTSKTQGSFWDDIIYERGTESWVKTSPNAKLKMMTPDEFIKTQKTILGQRSIARGEKIPIGKDLGDYRFERGIFQEKLNPIREAMKNPKNTFDSFVIERDATGKLKDFQEGRNRAVIAKELGYKEIPVWEFTDKKIVSRSYMGLELRKEKKPFGQNPGDYTVLPGKTPITAKWSAPAISTTRKPTVLLSEVQPGGISFLGSEPSASGIPRRMGPDFTPVDFNKPVAPRTLNAEAMRIVDRPIATNPPEAWRDVRTSGVPVAAARPVVGEVDIPITMKPANFYRDMEIHFGETGGSRPTELRGSTGQVTLMKPQSIIKDMTIETPMEAINLPRVESTTLLELEGSRGIGMNKQPTLAQSHKNWMNRRVVDTRGMRPISPRVQTPYDIIKSEARPISPATIDNNIPYKSEMWKQYYELPGTPDMSYTKGDSLKRLRDMLGARKSIATIDTRGTAIKGRGVGVYPLEGRVVGSILDPTLDQIQLLGISQKATLPKKDTKLWGMTPPKTSVIPEVDKIIEPVKPQKTRVFAPMSISRVLPVLAILPKEMGIQKTIPDKPFAPMITRPGRPAPPFEPTPTRPVVPFAWLPGAGESGGGRPFMNRGEYGWSNLNPVADIPYLSKGLGDPFSGGGSGSMGGFGAKCRHTSAKLRKKCSRFKRNG